MFTREMWDHFYWRFLNGQNPDDGLPLFDGTGAGRGKLSREDIDNRIGAAGMWWDPHLGIYHVRHRAYDPRLGRFLQPDPIGVAGGWNVFEYVGGDPANGIDPLGLYTLYDWWMDIGAGAGVIGDGVSYVTNSAYRMVAGNGSPQLSEGFEAGIRLREDIARDLNGSAGDAARTHAEDMRNFQREMGTASDLAFNVVLYNIATGLNVRTDAVGLAALQKGYRVVREGDRDIAIATNGQRVAVIAADTTGTVKAAKGAEGATDAAKAAAACGAGRLATKADEAVFWSGIRSGEATAAEWAGRHGGTTLESTLAARGIKLPAWDPANPASVAAWRQASQQFAAGASGNVRVLQGNAVRINSVWAEVEFPALQANPNVKSIIGVHIETGEQVLLWSR